VRLIKANDHSFTNYAKIIFILPTHILTNQQQQSGGGLSPPVQNQLSIQHALLSNHGATHGGPQEAITLLDQ